MIRALLAAALAACTLFAATPARAEEGDLLTGTLKTIGERGTILIGTRTSAVPFAFLNRAGQPVGFSLDICHAIAAEAAKTLDRDLLEPDAPAWQSGIRIVFVPTAADERLLPWRLPAQLLARWSYDEERCRELTRRDRSSIYGAFHLYTLRRPQ